MGLPNPLSVFMRLLHEAFCEQFKTPSSHRGRPGELIARLSTEERETLSKLSSQDVAMVRVDTDELHMARYDNFEFPELSSWKKKSKGRWGLT